MVRQGDSITIRKREDVSRKRDKNDVQVQEPHITELAVKDLFDDSSDYTQLKSSEVALREILKMLQDDEISRVALYGVCGVGKTTLAIQVGKRAKTMCIFNLVVFVCLSETPNVNTIQRDIADQLGLRLGEEDDLQRQISLRLRNNEERVLIILDGVRTRLDLQGIGILNDGSHMGCKLLLTTRLRELGDVMGFQRFYNLLLLSKEEAWYLFRKRAGIDDGSPLDFISLARKVAEYCGGLPLAISSLGSALRGKTVDQLEKALETSDPLQIDRTSKALQLMRFSYGAISSKVAKAVVLIGSLFPAGHEILIEDLSRYAVRLGLCSSKSEVSAAINTLKDCCFLMHSHKSKDHVTMHDLVRDMAVRMVYSENPTYGVSIHEYLHALRYEKEDCPWQEKLDRLLRQLYGVREQLSSSTSNSTSLYGGGGEGHELQVVRSYSSTKAAAIPKPSGKLADFYGLCRVDKSFLPLLKEACAMRPQLIESQSRHSEIARTRSFDCLGLMLFMLHNVRKRDWVHHKDELEMFWEQLKAFKFDLGWLCPVVEGVFSSAEIARIEALLEEEKYWSEEAARRREHLRIAESKVADIRTEIARAESELNGFAIAQVSNVRAVSKVTPTWKKFFFKK